MRIDLYWVNAMLGGPPPRWSLGRVYPTGGRPRDVADALSAREPGADYIYFRDATLGVPDEAFIAALAQTPGDVRHAGLALGMAGLPHLIDYVDPVWRFNRDPAPDKVATSWRLSLRACLTRAVVVEKLGGPDPHFETLAAASLEMGHRWIQAGALMRHIAELVTPGAQATERPSLPLDDEMRFLRLRYGRMWTAWACWRNWRRGGGLADTVRAFNRPQPPGVPMPDSFVHAPDPVSPPETPGRDETPTVSVLIPTLDRYPHLFNLLAQLREQTIPPLEIIVIDQTQGDGHDPNWPATFTDLPLRVIWRDQAGQCSSRNAGLEAARGDAILFLDDDDEIESDLIARHLSFMDRFDVDASCGVAEETGMGALPPSFHLIRESDVFPTNNTLLKTAALKGSGLFDLAYEKGERADHDLGMRLYLSGARLALNPGASVVHLHAPRGGLRQHKARVVTRASSRASIWGRQFLAPTEGYLWYRYFSPAQAHEALLIRTLGTLRGSQTGARHIARIMAMTLLLPFTRRKNFDNLIIGREKLVDYPQIPNYTPASAGEAAAL